MCLRETYFLLPMLWLSGCTGIIHKRHFPVPMAWNDSDAYVYSTSADALALGSAVSSEGTLYSVGAATDSSQGLFWIVRMQSAGGSEWANSESFQRTASWDSQANAIAIDADDTLWVAGQALDNSGNFIWLVRSKTEEGSWVTSDEFVLSGSGASSALSLAVGEGGDIYAAGSATDSSGFQHAIVRLYDAESQTWSTFMDYQESGSEESLAQGIAVDADSGDVAVVGHSRQGSDVNLHVWRYDTAWHVVDFFQASAGKTAAGTAAAFDENGNLFVVGMATASSDDSKWVVRRQSHKTPLGDFSTKESFQLETGFDAWANSVRVSPETGIVYAAGTALASSGFSSGLVRKLSEASKDWESDTSSLGGNGMNYGLYSLAFGPIGNAVSAGFSADLSFSGIFSKVLE